MRNVFVYLNLLLLTHPPVYAEQVRVFHDPFAKPHLNKLPQLNSHKIEAEIAPLSYQLTSTLRAGKNSMVIIGGQVIKLGEKIDGFELVSVDERAAVFKKNQQRTRLSLDEND